MAERTASEKNGLGTQSIDLLGRYILEGKRDPDFITERQIMGLTVMSIFAGSDSTATTLRTIFYYVMKQPWMMDKLMAELNDASFDRQGGIISWKAARELPYLTAVVQESLRLFPAVGVPLERVVPAGGLEVCGHFIPAGTVVGVSAWPLHRKESMFGPQPDEFRPERWIDASEDEKTLMNNALFSFGMGSRTCIGKNISLLEIYKLVPTILRKFEVSDIPKQVARDG
jgi:cytochrome P450